MGWKGGTFAFHKNISLSFPLNFTTHTAIIYLKSHANVKKVCLKCVNFNIIGRQPSGMGQTRLPLSLGWKGGRVLMLSVTVLLAVSIIERGNCPLHLKE